MQPRLDAALHGHREYRSGDRQCTAAGLCIEHDHRGGRRGHPAQAGETSVTFELPIFYPDANPPPFAYAVRATATDAGDIVNCAVTNGSGELGSGAGDVADVTVTSCNFTIGAV